MKRRRKEMKNRGTWGIDYGIDDTAFFRAEYSRII